MNEGYYISTDIHKMDIPFIHDYLSRRSYWALGRAEEEVIKSMKNSMCFGVFNEKDVQVGFARIATDFVVFAWVMDVFIDEAYLGLGLGKKLIEAIVEHPELQNVNGIGLRTNDAHELYKKFGFEGIEKPETWMLKKMN